MSSNEAVCRVILITGLPCSGKTTLARQVSAELMCPMLSKDDYKEQLADGVLKSKAHAHDSNAAFLESRTLGIQAEVMMLEASLDLARSNTTHVAESVLRPEYICKYLHAVSSIARVLVVVLQCKREVLIQRFGMRTRHAIHNDLDFISTIPTMREIDGSAFRKYAVEVVEFDTSELSDVQLKDCTTSISAWR